MAEWDSFLARLNSWRALGHDEQLSRSQPPPKVRSSDGRIRVGMLSPCLNQGGAEAWMLTLARTVDPELIEWVGCCVATENPEINPEMSARMSDLMPVTSGILAARDLAERCDVLVTWAITGIPNLLGGMASKPKVISVCHAPAESPWGRDVYGRSSGIDHWVAVSELALEAIPIAARESTPTSVIWNAVDASRMTVTRSREEMHARWGLPPGAKVAGFLGRLSAEKDPHALRRMIDHLPDDWHAVLVGAGFEYVKPHERLHLVGNDPLAGDVLGAFDTLIVPSHYESFCLVMGEAWWSGLAVVSTDVGLSRMSPGLTRTIPVGSSGEAVANAVLLDLIDTSGVADRIGRAFRFARERLSPDRFGREWTTLIRSLVPPTLAERLSCVRECPDRGNVLPISMQPEGCSKCGEKSECRSGKGEIPGRVSLRECLECVDLAGIVRKTN